MDIKLNATKDQLTIVLPYNNSDDAPMSASGKSLKRASTSGNIQVALGDRTIMLGVNAFEKLPV